MDVVCTTFTTPLSLQHSKLSPGIHPHFLRSCGQGVFPAAPRSKSRQATQALPMRQLHRFSDWLWWPNESLPGNICWNYWERKTFLPTGVTGRMWTCSLPPWRESLPEKEGNKEEKLARVSESFLIPSSEHLHQVVPEDKLDFSITSVNNFPLVCMTSVSDTCN